MLNERQRNLKTWLLSTANEKLQVWHRIRIMPTFSSFRADYAEVTEDKFWPLRLINLVALLTNQIIPSQPTNLDNFELKTSCIQRKSLCCSQDQNQQTYFAFKDPLILLVETCEQYYNIYRFVLVRFWLW